MRLSLRFSLPPKLVRGLTSLAGGNVSTSFAVLRAGWASPRTRGSGNE